METGAWAAFTVPAQWYQGITVPCPTARSVEQVVACYQEQGHDFLTPIP